MDGYDKDTLVIIPTKDTFDDQCFDDQDTVIGSFFHKLYPSGNEAIKEEIKKKLAERDLEPFNIGGRILIQKIESHNKLFNIGIVAVTHPDEGGGVIAHPENIMSAFKSIHKILRENYGTYKKVFIPLMGSGKGSVSKELALLCLLISMMEGMRKDEKLRSKEVNIVIKKEKKSCDIPVKEMKRIVKFALNHCM